jgi:hypothetical protein
MPTDLRPPSFRAQLPRPFACASALLLLFAAESSSAQEVRSPPTSEATARLAQRLGVAEGELELLHETEPHYPLTGQSGRLSKVLDRTTGTLHAVFLDERGGELDLEGLELGELAARDVRFGRFDPELHALVRDLPDDARLAVLVWMREPEGVQRTRPEPGELDVLFPTGEEQSSLFEGLEQLRRAQVAEAVAPLTGRMDERGWGHVVDEHAPLVAAVLSVAQLRELAAWPGVDTIYLDALNEPALEVARAAIRATAVNDRGLNGSGVRIAQVEVGGRVSVNNPNLAGVVRDLTYACSSASSHSTTVAGILRSTHSVSRGIARSALLWAGGSCSGSSSQLISQSSRAATWGARAFNLSWGRDSDRSLTSTDRYYDGLVINSWRTVVVAAGNAGTGNGNVITPALAYNVITVGNFDDRGTSSWSGDVMNPSSSWRDPRSSVGDREKPELAAPGTSITSTTTSSPWIGNGGSGTSFAAPMVTGSVALLIQRNGSLAIWPEAVKAILMATANHNLEGSSRLSERDGAGGVNIDLADGVARGLLGGWGGLNYSCSAATNLDVAAIHLTAGRTVRMAIAWDNDPNYSSYASRPGADLDLLVIGPTGGTVASSVSFDNTYEIVQFTAPASGTYRLRVQKFRCSYSPRFLGWAIWRD